MTIEAEFLIVAVRRFLNPEAALPDPKPIDWTALVGLAAAHAVTPMLYAALREQSVPEAVQENLRCALEDSVRRSLAQSGEFARVAALFEERGIPMVALKGPLLGQYLYGDLGARTSGDIDLLAKPKDVVQIHDVLISEGYRLTLHWNTASACLRSRENEVSFESPSGVSIDVHWRLVPPYFASAFDELDGWESLRTVTLAGRQSPYTGARTPAAVPLLHGPVPHVSNCCPAGMRRWVWTGSLQAICEGVSS